MLQEYQTPYSSYYSTENSREVSDMVTTELVPLYQSIDLDLQCWGDPYISIKVCRWLKDYIPAVLGHQNDSNKLWHPFVLKLRCSTAPKPWVSRLVFLLEQWSHCRPAQHTKSCQSFLDTLYVCLSLSLSLSLSLWMCGCVCVCVLTCVGVRVSVCVFYLYLQHLPLHLVILHAGFVT